jgi:hypothetical protein
VAIQDLLASPALINSGRASVSTRLLVSKTWRDTALDIVTEQDRGVWLLTFPPERFHCRTKSRTAKVERVDSGEKISKAG